MCLNFIFFPKFVIDILELDKKANIKAVVCMILDIIGLHRRPFTISMS